ncbi:MAG: transposase [Anaerolineae bacterium]
MLRDRYPVDPLFMEVLELTGIKSDPELIEIDRLLEDDEIFQRVKHDLSQRHPKTLLTGRNSTPVEVIIRQLAVKHLYDWSYEDTFQFVSDSLVLRWFCRVHAGKAGGSSSLRSGGGGVCTTRSGGPARTTAAGFSAKTATPTSVSMGFQGSLGPREQCAHLGSFVPETS